MPTLGDRVFDAGLSALDTEVTALHICSSEPASFAAVAGASLGNKTPPAISAPADGTPNGRAVTVSAITDGTVTATGTATHYALIDSTNSRLLATGSLSASQAVTNGNTFTLTQFTIRIPDPA